MLIVERISIDQPPKRLEGDGAHPHIDIHESADLGFKGGACFGEGLGERDHRSVVVANTVIFLQIKPSIAFRVISPVSKIDSKHVVWLGEFRTLRVPICCRRGRVNEFELELTAL